VSAGAQLARPSSATRRSVGEEPYVVLFEELLRALGVFLEAEVDYAANAYVLQEGQRLLCGVATSVHPVRYPKRKHQEVSQCGRMGGGGWGGGGAKTKPSWAMGGG
jgi:hypothetical protein